MRQRQWLIMLAVATVGLCNPDSALTQGQFPGTGLKADWLKANGFYAEGNMAKEAKDYEKAIAKYRQAIAIYGGDFHYHYNLAVALKLHGETEAAAASFRQSSRLNCRDWKSWKGLGNCLYKTSDYKGAGAAFAQALKCAPPANEAAEMHKGVAACAARAR